MPGTKLARCKIHIFDVAKELPGSVACDVSARAESKSGAVFRKGDPR